MAGIPVKHYSFPGERAPIAELDEPFRDVPLEPDLPAGTAAYASSEHGGEH